MYNPDMFIFIDETRTSRRDAIRKYRCILRGKPVKAQKLLVRGEHLSAIGAMTMNSVLDAKATKDSVNADVFYDYIQTSTLPNLLPFNAMNPRSVVILDNCAIDHAVETVSMV